MTSKYISSSTAIPTFLAKNNTIECQANRAGKFKKRQNSSCKSVGI